MISVRVARGLGLQRPLRQPVARFVLRVLEAVARVEGRSLALSVYVCGEDEMCRLHARWMDDASPTDVLSFPLRRGPASAGADGEIVVCADVARQAARRHGNSLRGELALYVVHGALHLLGYDDRRRDDRRRMQRAERRVLDALALSVNRATRRRSISLQSRASRAR